MLNNSFWPSLFAFCSVFFATLVLIEFGIYVAGRYRERFLEEAGTELDDVLIQMPAGRVLDISLGLATAGVIATAILLSTQVESFSWKWGALVAFGVGAVLFMVPRIILRYLKKRRLRKFNIQLEEALGIISSSLKAGFSINQALDEVAGQNIHPVSVEFRLLTQEIRLGVPLEQALENMNSRLGSDDFELVATAVLTARQTGGELTGHARARGGADPRTGQDCEQGAGADRRRPAAGDHHCGHAVFPAVYDDARESGADGGIPAQLCRGHGGYSRGDPRLARIPVDPQNHDH